MKSPFSRYIVLLFFVICIPMLSVTAVSGWPIKYGVNTVSGFRTFTVGDVISASPGNEAVTLSTSGHLMIYSQDGEFITDYRLSTSLQTPTLADFNNDGRFEIVVAAYNELHLIEDGVDSVIYSGHQSNVYRPIVVADLNDDETLEIAYITHDSTIYVHDASGNILPGWPQQPFAPVNYNLIGSSPLAVGDLDKDGTLEIIVQIFEAPNRVVTGAPTIFAFNLDGTIKWQVTVSPDYINYSQSSADTLWFNDIALGDVDHDQFLEVVYFRNGSYVENVAGFVYIFDHLGEIQEEWSIPYAVPDLTFSSTMAQIALGDLDNDFDLEIVVAGRSFSDRSQVPLFAWHHDANLVNGFPAFVPEIGGATDSIIAPMLADVDGDGMVDIVSSLYSNRNNFYNRIYAWNGGGQLLQDWPIELERVYNQSTIGMGPWNQSTLADINNDGTIDLIAPIGSMEAHAVDLIDAQCLAWPMFRHDVGRTGRYERFNNDEEGSAAALGESHSCLSLPQETQYVYLPLLLHPDNIFVEPIFIGNEIPSRDVNTVGEVFYETTIQIPTELPSTGEFYLSSQPNRLTPVLVDDAIALKLGESVLFSYDFSEGDDVHYATISIPMDVVQAMKGNTITVEYYDIYGNYVSSSEMWLIWVP